MFILKALMTVWALSGFVGFLCFTLIMSRDKDDKIVDLGFQWGFGIFSLGIVGMLFLSGLWAIWANM
jgi:hypothetical protein